MTIQPAAWLLIAALCQRKAQVSWRAAGFARAAVIVAVVEMAALPTVRYAYPQFGGVAVLGIVLVGLLGSRKMVPAWTVCTCIMSVSQLHVWNWTAYTGWCLVYVCAGGLVFLFAKYLDGFFEASLGAGEQQRGAIVAERTRFARDIHDTLAQGFTGIMMQLNAAEQRLPEDSAEAHVHIEKARRLAGDSLNEARRSASALQNSALANGTLLDAIDQIGQTLTVDSGVRLLSKLEGRPYALPEQCEANLLRIAQEALTNAVRHASASSIDILLAYRPGVVVLEVADSGHGMTGGESAGFGLGGMKERALQIGAQMKILSGAGQGTRIIVTVPNA
jgi:signal transduction histidine kinase